MSAVVTFSRNLRLKDFFINLEITRHNFNNPSIIKAQLISQTLQFLATLQR